MKDKKLPFKMGLFFGTLYFVQGFGDPTGGLMAQPVQSLLKSWEWDSAQIGTFMAMFWLPWTFKPLYGVITDHIPIRGLYRKSYLILMSLVNVLGLVAIAFLDLEPRNEKILFWFLMLPTIGFAFTDVVVDALMIEKGQPLGLTGKIQSVQWTSIYAAFVITGITGGFLAKYGIQKIGFVICGAMTSITLYMSIAWVEEKPYSRKPGGIKKALVGFWEAAKHPAVLGVGAFLFLWSFNPFSTTVMYLYATETLGVGEEVYGTASSISAAAQMVAAGTYGFICRRIKFNRLIHLAIITGIICSAAYAFVTGSKTLIAANIIYGFAYMTSNLIQLDLAARSCPTHLAGTVFALLMSLCNIAVTWSGVIGGHLYKNWSDALGFSNAYRLLVLTGCCFTALCWLVVPYIRKNLAEK